LEIRDEFRAFVALDEQDKDTGLYFVEFSEALTLKQVIVCAELSISRQKLSEALGSELHCVEQTKARLAFKTFSVVHQSNTSLWR